MKTITIELLNRFLAFLGLVLSPRRSFAFRLLEREYEELKARCQEQQEEIRQLNEYSRYVAKQPLLTDAQPKQKKEQPSVKQGLRRRAEIEAKNQKRFKQRYENILAAKEKRERKAEESPGFPNDYPVNSTQIS